MIKIWHGFNSVQGYGHIYRCPFCKKISYADLCYCPHCGEYMLTENPKIRIGFQLRPLRKRKANQPTIIWKDA